MKKLLGKMDKWLLFLTVFYAILGLIMIFSASSVTAVHRFHVSPYHFFVRQALFLMLGFAVAFTVILRLPTSKYKFFVPILLIGILVALAGLNVYGTFVGGAQRWYNFGFISFQPTEFAKTILIIYLAVFYSKHANKPKVDTITYLIPLAITFVMFMLIAMQPDLGGALILGAISFFIFISIPIKKNNQIKILKLVGIGAIVLVVGLIYSGAQILSASQMRRFEFRQPCLRYLERSGYQVCNSQIAFHNGGLFGVGLGDSTQKYLYLPEGHTDFIFPIIVEELGFIIGVLLIFGYIFMLYRILRIAKAAENLRCSILAYGTFLFILLHILVNLLGVLALIPLTGVSLPFLSYGGSFTINIIAVLFIVQRVAIENNINKNKREIKNM